MVIACPPSEGVCVLFDYVARSQTMFFGLSTCSMARAPAPWPEKFLNGSEACGLDIAHTQRSPHTGYAKPTSVVPIALVLWQPGVMFGYEMDCRGTYAWMEPVY